MILEHLAVLNHQLELLTNSLSNEIREYNYGGLPVFQRIGTLDQDYKYFRDQNDKEGKTVSLADYYYFKLKEIDSIKAHIRRLEEQKGYFFHNHITRLNDLKELIKLRITDNQKNYKTEQKDKSSLDWNGDEHQIRSLYQLLKDYNLVHSNTSLSQVQNVFGSDIKLAAKAIKWLESNALLVYFFESLLRYGLIQNKLYQSYIERYKLLVSKSGKLLTKNNLSTTKTNSEKRKNNPVGCEKIDQIINQINKVNS